MTAYGTFPVVGGCIISAPLRDFRADSNDAVAWHSGKLWSLWDMLKVNAAAFYDAISMLRLVEAGIKSISDPKKADNMEGDFRIATAIKLTKLQGELRTLGTPITGMAAAELCDRVRGAHLSYEEFADLVGRTLKQKLLRPAPPLLRPPPAPTRKFRPTIRSRRPAASVPARARSIRGGGPGGDRHQKGALLGARGWTYRDRRRLPSSAAWAYLARLKR
jgi:hypothetical protein